MKTGAQRMYMVSVFDVCVVCTAFQSNMNCINFILMENLSGQEKIPMQTLRMMTSFYSKESEGNSEYSYIIYVFCHVKYFSPNADQPFWIKFFCINSIQSNAGIHWIEKQCTYIFFNGFGWIAVGIRYTGSLSKEKKKKSSTEIYPKAHWSEMIRKSIGCFSLKIFIFCQRSWVFWMIFLVGAKALVPFDTRVSKIFRQDPHLFGTTRILSIRNDEPGYWPIGNCSSFEGFLRSTLAFVLAKVTSSTYDHHTGCRYFTLFFH